MKASAQKTFQLVLIKPSHYDDDGYVIQWFRSSIPSNTLATIYGLALDCIDRRVLGEDVQITVSAQDETNTRINVKGIARDIQRTGGKGLVALVGVQTNQFPRAADLALQFCELGIQVCIGGFHPSGCLSMLKELPPDLQQAMDNGISIYAGELEGRLNILLREAYAEHLQPLYNFMKDLPHLEGQPIPYLPAPIVRRMSGARASFDAGRGCPYLCSFCTIINVQGRKSRYRNADDVEQIIRVNVSQGIRKFFVTDDNLARNKVWESLFDRLISLREEQGIEFSLTIQVDTLCHKIPGFIKKAGRAGVDRVFIGLESINPEALIGARKTQNNITEYRKMLQAWHEAGALTLAGYILGFPTDTPERIQRDIRIIQRELPVDLLEFFILTPLPGSQDHKELHELGVPLDPDMNKYDTFHVTAPHPLMSAQQWLEAYQEAWETYYTDEHVETVMRRSKEWGFNPNKVKWMMLAFYYAAKVEGVHPLDSGLFRRKYRTDRRPGIPLENPVIFYSRYLCEIVGKHVQMLKIYLSYHRAYLRVMKGQSEPKIPDVAMMPVEAEELDELDLFTVTTAARTFVDKVKKKSRRKLAATTKI